MIGADTPPITGNDLIKIVPADWTGALVVAHEQELYDPDNGGIMVSNLMEEICYQVQRYKECDRARLAAEVAASEMRSQASQAFDADQAPAPQQAKLDTSSTTRLILHRALATVLARTDSAPATLLAGDFNDLVTQTVDHVVEVLADLS